MKVDLGTCAVCGAKNSKFVEACYKCGAPLPWAPNYVAPPANSKPHVQPAPEQKPADLTPAPAPSTTPESKPRNVSPPVVSPPLDVALDALTPTPGPGSRRVPEQVAENMKRRVAVPTWAIGALVLGCVTLGMGLVYLFGNRPSTPSVMPPNVPDAVPITSPTPAVTTAATPITTAESTAASAVPAPTSEPTSAPTIQPTPEPTQAVSPSPTGGMSVNLPPAARSGPMFDELWKNTHSGTSAQQDAYWQSVQGTSVTWRGEFVSLGSNPSGPLVMRCRSGQNAAVVTVELDESAITPQPQPNQSIVVEGRLQRRSSEGYTLTNGRVR